MKFEKRVKLGFRLEKVITDHEIDYINEQDLSALITYLKRDDARFWLRRADDN